MAKDIPVPALDPAGDAPRTPAAPTSGEAQVTDEDLALLRALMSQVNAFGCLQNRVAARAVGLDAGQFAAAAARLLDAGYVIGKTWQGQRGEPRGVSLSRVTTRGRLACPG